MEIGRARDQDENRQMDSYNNMNGQKKTGKAVNALARWHTESSRKKMNAKTQNREMEAVYFHVWMSNTD